MGENEKLDEHLKKWMNIKNMIKNMKIGSYRLGWFSIQMVFDSGGFRFS